MTNSFLALTGLLRLAGAEETIPKLPGSAPNLDTALIATMPDLINPATLHLSAQQLMALSPYLTVFGGACLAVILGVLPIARPRYTVPTVIALTFLAALVQNVLLFSEPSQVLFAGMLHADGFTHFANAIFLCAGIAVTLISFRYVERQNLQYPEFFVLISLSVLGMMLLSSSLNLIIVFIALELMSLSVYVLVGFRRNDRRSNEAAIKYYILGSAASAILLYGAALLYGATLSVDVAEIIQRVSQTGMVFNPMLIIGLLCVLIGFLFKVAAVPFHMWMPDVYEGAPTPITGLMTTGLKAAVFLTLLRLMSSLTSAPILTGSAATAFHHVLWVSALLTMFLGNVIALQQTNLKRMLAYSSIAHSGYLLVGLLSGPQVWAAYPAVLFYVLVYAIMNLGAFAVLTVLSLPGDSGLELSDLSGLSSKHPFLAFTLAVFLFSMVGLPPTAGFTSKYFLLYSAVQAGEVWLVVLAVLCSAIAAYYYLRVIVFMYMKEPFGQVASVPIRASRAALVTLALTAAMVLQLGVFPTPTLRVVTGLFPAHGTSTAQVVP